MGIVDTKHAHATVCPEKHDADHLGPQLRPVFTAKIERKYVFVFLGRIFRELNRSIRALIKPFRVLTHIGVIRGTIDREIECDLHSAFAHFTLEPIEIVERTERWLDRFVTARLASNRPRHAGIARLRDDRIVPPFAVRVTDRMDWRKIDYVETHRLGIIHSRQTIAECRSTVGAAFGRARKKFVPRGDLRFLALDNHARRRRILRRPRTVWISRHQDLKLAGMHDIVDLRVVGRANTF